jgi:hypothetical protein
MVNLVPLISILFYSSLFTQVFQYHPSTFDLKNIFWTKKIWTQFLNFFLKINIFLIFLNRFDTLILKIIYKK